ncbi:hypothetical protein E4U46_003244, partial [Claviceps purpurea]
MQHKVHMSWGALSRGGTLLSLSRVISSTRGWETGGRDMDIGYMAEMGNSDEKGQAFERYLMMTRMT